MFNKIKKVMTAKCFTSTFQFKKILWNWNKIKLFKDQEHKAIVNQIQTGIN